MERSIVFAGFGGQGILFAGQILAHAAIADELETLWIPSYGPEMRGGTASCTVIVGDAPIGSPVIDRADAAVVLNAPSLMKFASRVATGGLLVVNDSLIEAESGRDDIDELRLDLVSLARDAGDDKMISVVALGALVARLQVVNPEAVREALRKVVGKKRPAALAVDLAAFDAGLRVAEREPVEIAGR